MQDHTPDSIPLKHCPSCNQDKPATNDYFARDKRAKSGLRSQCKACVNTNSNPEKKAEYDRQYRAKNRERISDRKKQEYWANRDAVLKEQRIRLAKRRDVYNKARREKFHERYRSDPDFRQKHLERSRQWRQAHPEANRNYYIRNADKIKERVRQWALANPDRALTNKRKWRINNLEFARRSAYMSRKRRRAAPGRHTKEDVKRQYDAQKGKCYYCGTDLGDNYQTDHVIPLSRGGSNSPENIVVACPPCNRAKGTKLPHEWEGSNRLL